MRFSSPATRSMLLFVTFVVIFMHIFWSWVFARFVHAEAQYRTLMPEHYDVQVITAEEYRRLADPAVPKVTLADGTTMEKASAWYELVLPGYKPIHDGEDYALVTTYGTGHVLSYLEPILFVLGAFTCCGVGLSLWNLSRLQRETAPQGGEQPAAEVITEA